MKLKLHLLQRHLFTLISDLFIYLFFYAERISTSTVEDQMCEDVQGGGHLH